MISTAGAKQPISTASPQAAAPQLCHSQHMLLAGVRHAYCGVAIFLTNETLQARRRRHLDLQASSHTELPARADAWYLIWPSSPLPRQQRSAARPGSRRTRISATANLGLSIARSTSRPRASCPPSSACSCLHASDFAFRDWNYLTSSARPPVAGWGARLSLPRVLAKTQAIPPSGSLR
jgi:hypothetical protein